MQSQNTTVTLAQRDFVIYPLTIRKSKEWRTHFVQELQKVLGPLTNMLDQEVNLQNVQTLIGPVERLALESTDILLGLLYEYSPELEKAKDFIEDNAYDTEVITAFMEVLKLAYPFVTSLQGLMTTGQVQTLQTGKSSSSPNTTSPEKK